MSSDIYRTAPSNTRTAQNPAAIPVERSAAVELRRSHNRRRSFAFGQSDHTTADFYGGSLTADQAIYQAVRIMRNRARTLERDNSHIRKFLSMAQGNIIGAKGIRLQSKAGEIIAGKFVEDKLAQQIIESAFADFSKKANFSVNGRLGRRRFAQICLRRIFVDGEALIRIHRGSGKYGIQYQMIDSELLDHTLNQPRGANSNEIRMGVELTATGAPVAYHILSSTPPAYGSAALMGSEHIRIPAAEMRHIYIQERPGQTRGFTWFVSAGLRAKMLDGIEKAVTVGYRVAASKMGFLSPNEQYEGEDLDAADVPTDVEPGMIDLLPKGVTLENFDPAYPNGDFGSLTKTVIRDMAAGLGVSYPSLGNDFSGVSYSAGQIGVGDDLAFYSDLQQLWIEEFEEPVADEFIVFSITASILKLPISKIWKFKAVKFQPPRRKPIDALKTHNAQRVALGDMSRGPFAIAAENDQDFEDVVDEFTRAKQLLDTAGLPIPESWGGGTFLSSLSDETQPPA